MPLPLIAMLIVALQGCSGQSTGPVVHPVKGRVTLDGVPVEGAGVALSPLVRGQGVAAFGQTLADGSYVVTSTHGGRPSAGAVAGDYSVLLHRLVDVPPTAVPPEYAPAPKAPGRTVRQWFIKHEWTDDRGQHVSVNYLPDAYSRAESSGLRVTVRPGMNDGPMFEFALRSDFTGSEQPIKAGRSAEPR